MDSQRIAKEKSIKIYEFILHLFAIGGIIMALDGLALLEKYTKLKILGKSNIWWVWLGVMGIAFLRLHILNKIKEKAYKKGKLLTEFMDEIKEKNKL